MKKSLIFALIFALTVCLGACATVQSKKGESPRLTQAEIDKIVAEKLAKDREFIAKSEIEKLEAEEKLKSEEKYFIKILGIKEELFGVVIILPAEPPIISASWWSPKIESGQKEFDVGITIFRMKMESGAFSYLIVADLQKIPLDQFALVIRYTHPESGVEYSHSVAVHAKSVDAK